MISAAAAEKRRPSNCGALVLPQQLQKELSGRINAKLIMGYGLESVTLCCPPLPLEATLRDKECCSIKSLALSWASMTNTGSSRSGSDLIP